MKVPYEFDQLAKGFYPGSNAETETMEQWIESVVRNHRSEQRKTIIKKFLDELLSGNYSDAELHQIWSSTSPSYNFSEGGHRVFLTEVRDMIEWEPE